MRSENIYIDEIDHLAQHLSRHHAHTASPLEDAFGDGGLHNLIAGTEGGDKSRAVLHALPEDMEAGVQEEVSTYMC